MRVVEDDDRRLVLRDRTSWISFVCWAAALVIVAFATVRNEPKGLITACIFFLFGIAFFRTSRVVFDKTAGTCTIKRWDMWRSSNQCASFDKIRDVLVQPMPANDSRSLIACRLSLLTDQGEIPLSSTYEPGLDRYEKMRCSVLKVISGQGFAHPASDPVETLLATGRRIDAIALLRRRENLSLQEAMQRVEALQAQKNRD